MVLVKALLGAMPAALLCWPNPVWADNAAARAAGSLDEIVVTAKKRPDPVADEVLTKKVEAALHADPFLFDEHVTVTTKNGIVTLEGIVFDEWDVRMAMRIARKTAGVRRVVTDFYIPDGQ
jgi:osmotically-inducible protein OsmY